MTGEIAFDYEQLWYIKLRGDGSKLPLVKWGGYSQDFESAEHVFDHDGVLESDYEYWGIVGVKGDRSLLIFDLDIHKAPDGFDRDDVTVPTETTVIRSQSGGNHVPFIVDRGRGGGKESDFEMTYELGWDIDIRGSYVKHHVVAPADIPGVGGDYEIVNDAGMLTVLNPGDAAERIRYRSDDESDKVHGEPLLRYQPGGTRGAGGVTVDRDVEPPAEMPTCYHRGLQIRAANPDDPNVNTHKINVLTAMCGLAAGYSIKEMVGHFCEEYAPGPNADRDKTRYQLEHIAEKIDGGEYAPPSISTLREYGILEKRESCHCPIDYHGAALDQADDSAGGHVAVLPPAVRDLASATSGWDWRHAAREGQRDLTIVDARERTTGAIAAAYERYDQTLIEALPTMGKSYGAVKAAGKSDVPITFLTGRGHKEQYGQVGEWCDEHGLSHYTLPSFARDCPTANGEHGEEWADRVRGWYNRGATPKEIHKAAEYVLGRPLPCQEHDGQRCPYASKWDFDPDEYDVLIGHYTHAHKSKVTSGRAVVIDEFPGDEYETTLGPELQGAISYWLAATEGIPFEDYTDLIENRDDQGRRADALLWFDERGVGSDESHVFDDSSAHAAAPLAVFTLLASDDLGNGFERANLDDDGIGVFDRGRGVVTLLRPPELEYARSVVALDGTPTREMWERVLGTRLNHRQVLANGERAEYVRDALNLNLIRTSEYVKPYNSPDHVDTAQDRALFAEIRERHGQRPCVITTSAAEHEYDADGVLEDVDETKHYGNVLGSNEFDDVRVGAVVGSNHFGDGYIKKWGAYAGQVVERNDEKGVGLSYGGFGDRVLTHMREHETLQAAMRFGRDGNGAVVYVHTNTLPEWVPLAGEGRVVRPWSGGMKQVIDAAAELGEWRTAGIVEHPDVAIGERQVFDHLNSLADMGVLERAVDDADRRGYVWREGGLHRLNEHGEVELDPVSIGDLNEDEVAEVTRSSIYTWEFRNSADDSPSKGSASAAGQSPGGESVATEGDPPPDQGG